MATPSTFSLFPLLPIELRLRIYDLILSHPRIIHLRTSDHPSNISHLPSPHPSLSPLNLTYSDISWTTRTPPPALLSVSRETRAAALSTYTLPFTLLPAGPEIIYLNPSLDTVFVHVERWPEMLRLLLGDVRAFDGNNGGRGVRRLAVTRSVWLTWFDPGINVVGSRRVEMLRGVEEVVVIMRREMWDDEDEGGALVVPERTMEVMCWEGEILEGWKAAKDAGLGDEVQLRMLAWRREAERG